MSVSIRGVVAVLAGVVLLPAAALADDTEAKNNCRQSDIEGTWLMMTNNDYAPSACSLKISKGGKVERSDCTTGAETAKLTGRFELDGKCEVFGNFKITTSNGMVLSRDISIGIMDPDHRFFTIVALEKGGKEISNSFVQRVGR
jgi:hypothetical protein